MFIEIPRDLLSTKTQPVILSASKLALGDLPVFLSGAEAIVDSITEKLRAAKAPLLYIGEQVKLNHVLREKILAFCHQHQIPFITSWFAKGLYDDYSDLCLGCYKGVFSALPLREYLEQHIDYVLDVGTSIFPQDTASAFHTNTHFIEQFNNRTVVKSALPHERDLLSLLEALAMQEIPRFDFTASVFESMYWTNEEKLDFHNISDVLNALQSADPRPYLYLPEVGNSYFASYSLKLRSNPLGRAWLSNPWYAAMGTSLPYARAVAERLLSQKIVYMRNDIFHLGKSGEGAIYHCSDREFDVQQLVRAYGGTGSRCCTVGEFKHAFSLAVELNQGICLIEVPCQLTDEYQCRELELPNLYIRAPNGKSRVNSRSPIKKPANNKLCAGFLLVGYSLSKTSQATLHFFQSCAFDLAYAFC